jgi:hypothetical protein
MRSRASCEPGLEEDLGVDHVLGVGFLEVCDREVVEVLPRQKHAVALIAGGEKRGEIVERSSGATEAD